jgi:lysozyme family protein
MDFETALAFVLQWEGGYVDDPRDPGGATHYGITQRTARACGYAGRLRDIPMSEVRRIYRERFWEACRCDALPTFGLRLTVFDAAVHSGPARSIGWLQEAAGVKSDRVFGEQTLRAVQGCASPALLAERHLHLRQAFLRRLPT